MNQIIKFLPREVITLIKEYVIKKHFILTNKNNYILYHPLIKKDIKKYDTYIRDIIRRDNYFVFERIIRENHENWFKNIDYIYKNITFKNYIYFTIYYCIENDSPKCKSIIDNIFQELGLSKNQHKKNFVKYIRWKN
jgi:hypothetical protein